MIKKIIPYLMMILTTASVFGQQNRVNGRGTITMQGQQLPFEVELQFKANGLHKITIINGVEQIATEEVEARILPNGSTELHIYLPVFNTEIVGQFSDDQLLFIGDWFDRSRLEIYALPIQIDLQKSYRFFEHPLPPTINIAGRWATQFTTTEGVISNAIAVFEQNGNDISGTFLTATGDYRFLKGQVSADSFFLSAFDGAHAFLFYGKLTSLDQLSGHFYSGKHWQENFAAQRNATIQLPDPKSLTFLKDGDQEFLFAFPNELGQIISLADTQWLNRPVIIQIMGTWCPNCMDESSYLAEIEQKYKGTNLAIIALAFEREIEPEAFKKNIDRLRSHYGITYPILNAGYPKNASLALPMLNKVMSYPTTLLLDKNHRLVEIYTGYSGPATGQVYIDFKAEFEQIIQSILK